LKGKRYSRKATRSRCKTCGCSSDRRCSPPGLPSCSKQVETRDHDDAGVGGGDDDGTTDGTASPFLDSVRLLVPCSFSMWLRIVAHAFRHRHEQEQAQSTRPIASKASRQLFSKRATANFVPRATGGYQGTRCWEWEQSQLDPFLIFLLRTTGATKVCDV